MKSTPKSTARLPVNASTDFPRKKRRRHNRVQLEALRPPSSPLVDSLSQCPKCQGLIFVDGGEHLSEKVPRCLNCGWRPHHRLNPIQESDEARTMRSLTVMIVSGADSLPSSVNF
jgi:hypothetical protein